ncbi:MAG TPA: hydrogenase maturation nickel metallochaperone HypA [Bacteroidota bacterium]|nr:hydrogenase maturation nickel metallochaperone HypA [Bacteroidota bacterium]
MHEMSIAESIIEIVQQHLPKDEGCKVRSVTLRVGALAGVVPESLEFCFTALTTDTPLEGARLTIGRVPLTVTCRACSVTSEIDLESFVCPACKNSNIEVLSGMELQVTEIETDDGGEDPA